MPGGIFDKIQGGMDSLEEFLTETQGNISEEIPGKIPHEITEEILENIQEEFINESREE